MSKFLAWPAERKWLVFGIWIAVFAVAIGTNLPGKFTDAEKNESTSFLPGDAESTKALEATERLQDGELASAVIVYRREGGLTPADQAQIRTDVREMAAKRYPGVVPDGARAAGAQDGGPRAPQTMPGQPAGYQPFVGPIPSERGDAALVLAYLIGDGESDTLLDPVQFWRETIADPPEGLEVKLTGGAGYAADAIEVFESINGTLLLAAMLLVITLLILIYRSPVFLFIPLLAVVFAEVLSRSVGYGISELGVTVNGQSSSIMSVLVLGAGTDYALLLVARYREELHVLDDKHEAMRRALRSAGPAIFASGVTVIAALLCLSIAKVNGTAGLGPIGAMGVFCAMLSMLTFLPAALLVFGRRAFWPFVPHTRTTAPTEATTSPHLLERSRLGALAPTGGGVLLMILLLPVGLVFLILRLLSGGRVRNPVFAWLDRRVFRPYELRRVRHEHAADETHGFWRRVGEWTARSPKRVLVGSLAVLALMSLGMLNYSDGLTTADSYREKVESVEGQELLDASFPSGASAPTDIVVPDVEKAGAVAAAVQQVDGVASVQRNVSGDDGVLLQATLRPDPYSTEAFDLVEPIRAAAKQAGGDDVLVGGASAVEFDVREASADDTLLIPPIVLVVVFVILLLLLRAVIAPLMLIGSVIVSFAASLGVAYIVYDVVFGFPGSDPSLPLFAFVFLVALGIDYNIFLMHRVREETQRYGTRHGTVRGLAVTGGVITSAGIVLAGTFLVLGVLPLVFLTEIGFVVAFGVLLDTFLVRSVLVPAATLTIGPKVWWPSKLADPVVDAERDAEVETSKLEEAVPA